MKQSGATSSFANSRRFKLSPLALILLGLTYQPVTFATDSQLNSVKNVTLSEKQPKQQGHQQQKYNVNAGSLSQVLSEFAGQAGIALSFSADQFNTITSSGLQGRYSVKQAFSKLLATTGFIAQQQQSGSYIIKSATTSTEVMTLATLEVSDSSSNLATEGTGLYTAESVGIGKGNMALREIPQTVTVMTHQRFVDQNLVDLAEILNQTTGLTRTQDSRGGIASFYSRGFEINSIQIDGAATGGGYNGYSFSPNSSMYDSVEVIRGVDGLFSGSGGPGGTINLVRKKPLSETQVKVTAAVGSWDNYRGEVDVTGGLSPEGAIRGRVVLSYQDNEYFYDNGEEDSKFIYGIIEADLGDNTQLSFGGSYEDGYRKSSYAGIPRYDTGQHIALPRSTSFIADFAGGDFTSKEVFSLLSHKINDNWQINASATYTDNDVFEINAPLYDDIFKAGNTTSYLSAWGYEYIGERTFFDISLNGNFELLGQEHTVLFGADKQESKSGVNYHTVNFDKNLDDFIVDIFNFNSSNVPSITDSYISYQYQPTTIKQTGIYGRLNLSLTDELMFIVGGRYGNFKYDSVAIGLNPDSSIDWQDNTAYEEDAVLTPYIGAVYQVNDDWSLYGSFTEIHESQADNLQGPLPGTPLDPIAGENYELGLKGDLWQGKLNAMLALYHIKRIGEAENDPAYPDKRNGELGQVCCSLAQGEIISEGIEAEINGQLIEGWQISAGYTYNQNENTQDDNKAYSSITPKHLLKVWTSYQLPAQLHNWTIGGGVTAQSDIYTNSDPWFGDNRIDIQSEQAGYAIWSAMVGYDINESWSANLNIGNLFDKTYFSDVGSRNRAAWYGEPRSFTLTLRGNF